MDDFLAYLEQMQSAPTLGSLLLGAFFIYNRRSDKQDRQETREQGAEHVTLAILQKHVDVLNTEREDLFQENLSLREKHIEALEMIDKTQQKLEDALDRCTDCDLIVKEDTADLVEELADMLDAREASLPAEPTMELCALEPDTDECT